MDQEVVFPIDPASMQKAADELKLHIQQLTEARDKMLRLIELHQSRVAGQPAPAITKTCDHNRDKLFEAVRKTVLAGNRPFSFNELVTILAVEFSDFGEHLKPYISTACGTFVKSKVFSRSGVKRPWAYYPYAPPSRHALRTTQEIEDKQRKERCAWEVKDVRSDKTYPSVTALADIMELPVGAILSRIEADQDVNGRRFALIPPPFSKSK